MSIFHLQEKVANPVTSNEGNYFQIYEKYPCLVIHSHEKLYYFVNKTKLAFSYIFTNCCSN